MDQLAGDGPVGLQPGHRVRNCTCDTPVHSGDVPAPGERLLDHRSTDETGAA